MEKNITMIPKIGERRTYEVMCSQIEAKFSSKKDWVNYFSHHLQYYLPPAEMVTMSHLKQVLTNKKRFLKMSEVRFINV